MRTHRRCRRVCIACHERGEDRGMLRVCRCERADVRRHQADDVALHLPHRAEHGKQIGVARRVRDSEMKSLIGIAERFPVTRRNRLPVRGKRGGNALPLRPGVVCGGKAHRDHLQLLTEGEQAEYRFLL